jgi:hypothetical protein
MYNAVAVRAEKHNFGGSRLVVGGQFRNRLRMVPFNEVLAQRAVGRSEVEMADSTEEPPILSFRMSFCFLNHSLVPITQPMKSIQDPAFGEDFFVWIFRCLKIKRLISSRNSFCNLAQRLVKRVILSL